MEIAAKPDGRRALQTLRRMLGLLARHRSALIWSTALGVLSQVAGLAIPALVGRVVNEALQAHDRRLLWIYVAGIAIAGVLKAGLMLGRRLIGGRMSLDVEYDLRLALYTHLQRLSYAFYDRNQTGQLLSRATSDVGAVRIFLSYGLMYLTQHAVTIVAVSVLLIWTSPPLALLTFVLLPPIGWVAWRYSSRSHPVLRDAQQRMADMTTQVEENVVGVRVVKAFAQEGRESARFSDRNERVFVRQLEATRLQAIYTPLLEFLPQVGLAAILLAGGLLTIDGTLSTGGFVQFNLYLGMLILPLRMVGMWIGQLQRAVASGERVFDILDVEPEIVDPVPPTALPAGGGDVQFDGVTFGYSAERPVLRDVDLHIPAGRTVALIGRTGSGKSTLTSLIPRFYDTDAGSVRIDGVDVRELSLGELRRQIGIVSEETFLFSASVRENIAYGAPWASDEQIVEAARQAQAHEFISGLPEGYDTVVGERGLTLSGGQRQRVAIARALLLDPRILILDDATASVDASTEARIKLALRTAMRGRTTIIIAHRLSTIALADELVVLEGGRVVAQGDHAELLESSPIYAEIHRHGLVDRTFVDLDDDRVTGSER